MFSIRAIHAADRRVDLTTLDLVPNEQGQAVCDLFREFLSNRPPQFREKLPFFKGGEIELEWSAVDGGMALATFYAGAEPQSMGVLLTGIDREAEDELLTLMRETLLQQVLGEDTERCTEAPERPVLINLLFPTQAELLPVIQLLAAGLASVFFRLLLQLRSELEHNHGAAEEPA